jgi:hypothetical protein
MFSLRHINCSTLNSFEPQQAQKITTEIQNAFGSISNYGGWIIGGVILRRFVSKIRFTRTILNNIGPLNNFEQSYNNLNNFELLCPEP